VAYFEMMFVLALDGAEENYVSAVVIADFAV
jgi:hypothetical protein